MRAHVLQRQPAGRAEPLEASQLGLDGDARRRRGVDQRQAVGEHRRGGLEPRDDARGTLRARRLADAAGGELDLGERGREPCPRLARALDRGGPQPRRIGVDAQNDLGLPQRDRLSEAVAERRAGARVAVAGVGGHRDAQPGAGTTKRRRPPRRVT